MRTFLLVSSLLLIACGGASQETKTAADPWSDFKGTYSKPGARAAEPAAKADGDEEKTEGAKAKQETPEPAAEEAVTDEAKPTSKAKIAGTSISSVDEIALSNAAKTALKKKVVSTSVSSGAQYEQVKIELDGAYVRIIRPVAPAEAGHAAVDAPKARAAALATSEAAYLDEAADVVVIVDAGKKAAAQKALAALLKR